MTFKLFHLIHLILFYFRSIMTFSFMSFKNTLGKEQTKHKGPLSPHFLNSLLKSTGYTYMFPPELESALSLF